MAWFSFTNLTRNTLARAENVNTIFQAIYDAFANFLPVNTAAFKEHRLNYAADTGAVNAYVVALDPVPSAYVIGMNIDMVTANANTGAATINVNGLGLKAIVQSDGSALTAGQIIANAVVPMRYDGTSFRLNGAVVTSAPTAGSVTTASFASSVYASQAEAEAGTENTKLMTPLRVAQQLAGSITVDVDAGTIDGVTIGGSSPGTATFTALTINTSIVPDANDGAVLGNSGNGFSDLFLADGAVINANAGDTTLTMNDGLILAGAATDVPLDLSAANAGQVKFPTSGNFNNSADATTLDGYYDWQVYTPTFTGFGTVSVHSMWWKRVGDTLHINGNFTAGTPTGVEARMSLPISVSSDATKVPALKLAGTVARDALVAASFYALMESNVAYITFGRQDGTYGSLAKQLGNVFSGTGHGFSIKAEIPISGW